MPRFRGAWLAVVLCGLVGCAADLEPGGRSADETAGSGVPIYAVRRTDGEMVRSLFVSYGQNAPANRVQLALDRGARAAGDLVEE